MAATTLISVEQYLQTAYDPDCDYIDGEVLERNMGEEAHSQMQLALLLLFSQQAKRWQIVPRPELRVQVAATRFRVADVLLMGRPESAATAEIKIPVLCIEVLSSGQTLREMQVRTDDYLAFGVPQVWIIDPLRRVAYAADLSGRLALAPEVLDVPNTPILLTVEAIFREFDQQALTS